jgi:hypothetical protein
MTMRKFTLFLFVMLIGSMLYAQRPVVTPVWDNSVHGTADWSAGIPIGGEVPSWMGGTSERGMAFYDGKLFVVSRKVRPHLIQVLDAETGNWLKSIEIDTLVAVGGTFTANDIAITPSGKILVANLATNTHTQPFKVYMFEEDGEGGYEMSTLLSWNSQDSIDGVAQPLRRLGDGFAFYGDISDEDDGYIIVGDANGAAPIPLVFRWNVEAGVVNPEPVVIELKEVYPAPIGTAVAKLGLTPRIQPLDNDHFWADGHSTFPALYNMQGELLTTFTGQYKPVQSGISGVNFFSFKGHDFILAPATNHAAPAYAPKAAFQLFKIPAAGAEEADSLAIFPERGLGGNTNASYAAPMAVDINTDHVMMYIMSPNNGLAAYKLTLEEEISDVREWNMSNDAFKNLGIMTTTSTVEGLKIYAEEGKSVDVDGNNKTLEDWVFTHRIKFGGTGSFDEDGKAVSRVLAFDVTGNSKITIALQSASSSADRVLNVAAGHKDEIFATIPALGASISKGIVEYKGGAQTIYLYSPNSGVNIYLIRVEPLVTNVPIVSNIREEVKVFPNPASGRVFVNVNTPTEVGIFTLTGSLVKLQMVESSGDAINIGDMKTGVYIIKSTRTNDFATKLIVR